MASYGSFEINREIASAEGSTVYTAHKEGESVDQYAVKVFSLVPEIGDNQETRTDLSGLLEDLVRSFLDRVAVQKKVAEASRYFAPVLESGKDERGAWYA